MVLSVNTKYTEGFSGNPCSDYALDGRNRAIVIAESLARVIAAIRIASVRWSSYLLSKHRIWSS